MLIPVLRSPAAAELLHGCLDPPTVVTPPEEMPSMACGIQTTQPEPRGQIDPAGHVWIDGHQTACIAAQASTADS